MKRPPYILHAFAFIACASLLSACSNVSSADQMIHDQLDAAISQEQQTSEIHNNVSGLFQASTADQITEEQTQQMGTVLPQTGAKIVPIVMFHYVRVVDAAKDPLGYNLSINPADFEKILKYLSVSGYHTIHVEDLLTKPVQSKDIILTFDDGYEDFFTTARPLLQKYGFTASEGIITSKMDGNQYMTPAQVQQIDKEGFEILDHTVHHTDLDKDPNQKSEIVDSQAYLEKLLNKVINVLVYPAGRYNDQTLINAKEAGYKIALTTKPGYANLNGDLLQLHRIRIDNRDGFLGFVKKLTNPN